MISVGFIIFFLQISTHLSVHQVLQNYNYVAQIPCPTGYERVHQDSESFGAWLRLAKIKTDDHIVHLYNGAEKNYQGAHYAILNFDVGKQDLQQCADAVMRLRTEYLWQAKKFNQINFHFTNGFEAKYSTYRAGNRIAVNGNKVNWIAGKADTTYIGMRKYLNMVFAYAGTWSLNKELIQVQNTQNIQPGDVFIEARQPYGHAVIVMDVARNPNGKICILLAQSYMPAQEIHILKNPNNHEISPWFIVGEDEDLKTPEWTFEWTHLKRFP